MPGSANGNIGLMSGWAPGDNGWDTGANTNWDALDALVQPTVKSTTLATPPASPANGDAYIVAASPTGAWAGKAGQIAVWNARGTGAWVFYVPKQGWCVYAQDLISHIVYSGAWKKITALGGMPLATRHTNVSLSENENGFLIYTGANAGVTLTIPSAGVVIGCIYRFVNVGANNVTLSSAAPLYITTSAGTGLAAGSSRTLKPGCDCNCTFDGVNWIVTGIGVV